MRLDFSPEEQSFQRVKRNLPARDQLGMTRIDDTGEVGVGFLLGGRLAVTGLDNRLAL